MSNLNIEKGRAGRKKKEKVFDDNINVKCYKDEKELLAQIAAACNSDSISSLIRRLYRTRLEKVKATGNLKTFLDD